MPRLSNAILRTVTGAFILNSGLNKTKLDEGTAGHMQGMAKVALPQVEQVSAKTFGKSLSAAEIALGTALLCPIVPSRLAGLGLTAFGAGLTTMYLKTPGMTEKDGIRPTQDGTALAKDSWLVAAGLALVFAPLKRR